MNGNAPARQGQQQVAQQQPREAYPGEGNISAMLRGNGKWFGDLIGADLKSPGGQATVKRFYAQAIKAFRKGGAKMAACVPQTFLDATAEAASLGLAIDPGLGECYLIPRNRSFKDQNDNWQKVLEVNFQMGYRGVLKLARRSGEITKIKAVVVYAKDEFEHFEGTDDRIFHKPYREEDPGEIIAAYAQAKVRGSDEVTFRVMYGRDLDKVAAKSGDPRDQKMSDVWADHYGEMAMKTALKRLCKWLPVSDELKSAIIRDDIRDDGSDPGNFAGRVTQDGPAVQPPRDLDQLMGKEPAPLPPAEQGPSATEVVGADKVPF